MNLQAGNQLFLFTDGFADQFGGPDRKKFMYKSFRELLISISEKSIEGQKLQIHDQFLSWKGDEEQFDDLTILGIRI